MRKLVSIVRISSCNPIEGTDRLSVAKMEGLGWNVVVSRNEFKPGNLAVFFEIDSYLPADDERYAFLRDRCLRKFVSRSGTILDKGLRIKTLKLRGVVSQGLLMPVVKFPEVYDRIINVDGRAVFIQDDEPIPYSEADITSILGVRHYDEIKEALAPATTSSISGDAYGDFPTAYIPKTDEVRLQADTTLFDTLANRRFEVTVKADGSSCTVFYAPSVDQDNPYGVCSRNIRLKPTGSSGSIPVMWQLAEKYRIGDALKAHYEKTGHEWAVQGEAVGPGIQSCRNRETEHVLKVFKIWDITKGGYVSPSERRTFCTENGIPHVEVIAEEMPVFERFRDLESILTFAEGKTAAGYEREGLVFKTVDEPTRSFKVISNRYLLKDAD